ncbi:MAG TPA: non-heme iron oxygenase ferredoxin subunit [Actinotalea sp.]
MSAQLACLASDVEPGTALRVELEGPDGPVPVAVVRDEEGDLHAISDICSHGQVSLSDGDVVDCTIECWLHGSTFDLRTGAPLALPATRPVPVYPVTVDGERVLVDVDVTVNA